MDINDLIQLPDMPVEGAPAVDPEIETEKAEFLEFERAKIYVNQFLSDFEPASVMAVENRERRAVDVNLDQARKENRIKQDAFLLPDRVIDRNISREKPSYVAYLQQSRRIVLFIDKLEPDNKADALENAFSTGMKYQGWLSPHYKVVDGAQVHGWDWAEVVYDDTKPLKCSIEHVGHDRLIYPRDSEDIQCCARILREYRLTKGQLRSFVGEFGFSKEQIDLMVQSNKDSNVGSDGTIKDKTYVVYKLLFKLQGVVWVAWYAKQGCTDWLKAPAKLFLGVQSKQQVQVMQDVQGVDMMGMPTVTQQPTMQEQWVDVDETEYPYALFIYDETEEKMIAAHKGRVFKDKHKQEAMTAGISAYITACHRSTYLLASPKGPVANASKLQEVVLKDGAIYTEAMDFWSPDGPAPQTLPAMQYLDTKNSNDTNQVTFAAQNKSAGSRTTAKEIESAESKEAELDSVQISLFSDYVRSAYTIVWRIVQSQAMQGKINLYGTYEEVPDPLTGETSLEFHNDEKAIGRDYDIRAAGDVDYVQRRQLIAEMKEFYPIIAQTPIAMEFLAEILKLQFGERGDYWANKLLAGDVKGNLLMQFVQIVEALIANPQEALAMGPEESAKLQMLCAQAQMALLPPEQQKQQLMAKGQSNAPAGPDSSVATGQPNPKVLPRTEGENAGTGQPS